MNESILKSLLEESAQLEWENYSNVPIHTFANNHNRSMKRIFKLFDKHIHHLSIYSNTSHRIRISRKTALIIVLVLFLAIAVGCNVAYFVSQSFQGRVYRDNTELFVINTENCPTVIEEKYYLSDLSQDFELLDTDSSPFYEYTSYKNSLTGQTISFSQWVKSELDSFHYNTEGQGFEEIEINGHYGLCLDFSSNDYFSSSVIWDNGDYILQISGDLSKNELIDLAKSAKVYEN